MTNEQIIEYWTRAANRDWKAAQDLASLGNLVQALFFAHLVIEKLLKAHWVKDNEGELYPFKNLWQSMRIKHNFGDKWKKI